MLFVKMEILCNFVRPYQCNESQGLDKQSFDCFKNDRNAHHIVTHYQPPLKPCAGPALQQANNIII